MPPLCAVCESPTAYTLHFGGRCCKGIFMDYDQPDLRFIIVIINCSHSTSLPSFYCPDDALSFQLLSTDNGTIGEGGEVNLT
uniref:Nuclear receptor domain-containing protein n=1 Tax=Caenorhabditis japonica TaxID=281687 RepID=A0A8R1ILF1_CAEJA